MTFWDKIRSKKNSWLPILSQKEPKLNQLEQPLSLSQPQCFAQLLDTVQRSRHKSLRKYKSRKIFQSSKVWFEPRVVSLKEIKQKSFNKYK